MLASDKFTPDICDPFARANTRSNPRFSTKLQFVQSTSLAG